MHFRPPTESTTPGRSAIELWDQDRHAATIYAQHGALYILLHPPYEADPNGISVDVISPTGVVVAINANE